MLYLDLLCKFAVVLVSVWLFRLVFVGLMFTFVYSYTCNYVYVLFGGVLVLVCLSFCWLVNSVV